MAMSQARLLLLVAGLWLLAEASQVHVQVGFDRFTTVTGWLVMHMSPLQTLLTQEAVVTSRSPVEAVDSPVVADSPVEPGVVSSISGSHQEG